MKGTHLSAGLVAGSTASPVITTLAPASDTPVYSMSPSAESFLLYPQLPAEIQDAILSNILDNEPSMFVDVCLCDRVPPMPPIALVSKKIRKQVQSIMELKRNGYSVVEAERDMTPQTLMRSHDMVLLPPTSMTKRLEGISLACCEEAGHIGVLVPSHSDRWYPELWPLSTSQLEKTSLVVQVPPQAAVSDATLTFKPYFKGSLALDNKPRVIGSFFREDKNVTKIVTEHWFDSKFTAMPGMFASTGQRVDGSRRWQNVILEGQADFAPVILFAHEHVIDSVQHLPYLSSPFPGFPTLKTKERYEAEHNVNMLVLMTTVQAEGMNKREKSSGAS
ncbi:hypothetical protein M406DRAFT_333731 [Cryphonectria parasitica EP155]|uniref:F-box domain-containing protein n=1 Tax=Cryphonectria parasitica (strain ATCC 38755 / EP155) TaxID=660469 RepID=A0A9P4XW53_CRYP1|nr:uncharacterized protein M406DRAFT_333731 [Cryphonectria parasitica EP155]KAF3761670.1 hypothetical protein M406DRAFT_333731 [Cryphonectria parasitica EP155]